MTQAAAGAADNPSQTAGEANPAPAGTGTESTGQAEGQNAPETFFSGDVTKLPPELRESYNKMLSDYRAKTTSVAEEKKAVAEALEKARFYDDLAKDERFVKYWNSPPNAEAPKTNGNGEAEITEDEWLAAQQSRDAWVSVQKKLLQAETQPLRKQLAEERKKRMEAEALSTLESFSSEKDREGKPLRPDFKKLEDSGLVGAFLRSDPPARESEYNAKLSSAYAKAKAAWEQARSEGKSEVVGQAQRLAGSSSESPSITAAGSYNGTDPRKLTTRQAWDLAKRGVRVPQN